MKITIQRRKSLIIITEHSILAIAARVSELFKSFINFMYMFLTPASNVFFLFFAV